MPTDDQSGMQTDDQKESIRQEAMRRAAERGLDWDKLEKKQRQNFLRKARAVLAETPAAPQR